MLGWEDLLEKGKATHSSILPWRTPRTVWSMGWQSPGLQSRAGSDSPPGPPSQRTLYPPASAPAPILHLCPLHAPRPPAELVPAHDPPTLATPATANYPLPSPASAQRVPHDHTGRGGDPFPGPLKAGDFLWNIPNPWSTFNIETQPPESLLSVNDVLNLRSKDWWAEELML